MRTQREIMTEMNQISSVKSEVTQKISESNAEIAGFESSISVLNEEIEKRKNLVSALSELKNNLILQEHKLRKEGADAEKHERELGINTLES